MEESNLSFDEYRNRLLKRNSKTKNFRIKNSWGSKYIHRSVDKNHILKKVSECDFLHIVRTINNYLVDELLEGKAITIPYLGIFYVNNRELRTFVTKDNRIVTQKPVDWYSTHKLWYTDEEARKEKTIIRFTDNYGYNVVWIKGKFKNKVFFKFTPVRALKLRIIEQAKNNKDLFIYGKY